MRDIFGRNADGIKAIHNTARARHKVRAGTDVEEDCVCAVLVKREVALWRDAFTGEAEFLDQRGKFILWHCLKDEVGRQDEIAIADSGKGCGA